MSNQLRMRWLLVLAWFRYQASKFYFNAHWKNYWVGSGIGVWIHFRNPSLRASGVHVQLGLGKGILFFGVNWKFDVAEANKKPRKRRNYGRIR